MMKKIISLISVILAAWAWLFFNQPQNETYYFAGWICLGYIIFWMWVNIRIRSRRRISAHTAKT